EPLADIVQAFGDGRQPGAGGKQPGDLARRRQIAEAVEAVARFDEPEHGKLLDDPGRQLAQLRQLPGRVALRLLLGKVLADPLQELALAGDGDVVALRLGEAVRRPAVIQERPAKLTDDEEIGLAGDAFARLAAAPAHERERVRPLHRRKLAGEGDGALEQSAVRLLRCQRAAFLLALPGARARPLVLAAAGFFLVSAPMLARNASMRLIPRRGAASALGFSIICPACFLRNSSTSAVS